MLFSVQVVKNARSYHERQEEAGLCKKSLSRRTTYLQLTVQHSSAQYRNYYIKCQWFV